MRARIVRGEGGAPIRTILEHNYVRPTGSTISLKNRAAFPWEARDEARLMWISEADFRVHSYMAQPFRMEFDLSDGSTLTYIPDLERITDSDVEICEVKRNADEAKRNPDYGFKLYLAKRVCALRGWKFSIISAEDEIRQEPLLSNARRVRYHRLTQLQSLDYLRLGQAAAPKEGRLTWGEAVAVLGGRDDPWNVNGFAKLCAMIVRRHVCVDLSLPLAPTRLVIPAEYLRAADR
ncbi:TnsA endonuclease N-terminal domain-containing protein [Bradyrhizobium sp. CCBAU 53380]|uniref:TnsA endonuclease N-terminal domain-containing protein n=1 Tax=Bradyrhizobium sp. CCBAU 53380 TaxID=1325117 RepID=UPI002303BAFA|nr:TnsA endonuclease N-terminal domain-containing protein [Bradyrhizobium sp. CCBAU 53380]MDA9420967.1 hypothetical protein [Bradyrhizobium sp. CCBAU 53380]